MAGSLLDRATSLRGDAVGHLALLAGDASMCAIGRSGRSFPAAKYHEGRQAAASQLRRALLRGDDEEQALASARSSWQATAAAAESRGGDWLAYAAGGLDALAELADPGTATPCPSP